MIRTRKGYWRPYLTPKSKKRTELLRQLKEVFQSYVSQPAGEVIQRINPKLRGWVNYFRTGHSSRCFGYVKDWVEKKIRRHLMRARKRQGFGWKRWRNYSAHLNSPAFSQINSPPASKEKKRGLRSSHESEMIITLIRIAQDGRHFIRINTPSALRKLLI